MHLNYRLTRKALLQGSRLQTNFVQIGLAVGAVMFVTLALTHVGDGLLPRSPIEIGWWLLFPAIGALASGVIFAVVFWAILLPFKVWQVHRQNPLLYGEMRLIADSDGIEVAGPRSTTRFAWLDIRGLKEDGTVFVVCLSRSAGFSIPKHGLAESEVRELGALLRGKLKAL